MHWLDPSLQQTAEEKSWRQFHKDALDSQLRGLPTSPAAEKLPGRFSSHGPTRALSN